MEILSPSAYHSSFNWLIDERESTNWTPEENKLFENALAIHDKDTPDRWHKVAAMIPGKTVGDVRKQYKELEDDVSNIEAGLIPIPGYSTSPFTLEWVNNNGGYDGFKQGYSIGGKRSSSMTGTRPSDHERKKGVPWTEDEHKLFLMGLKKYGKGDWRNISRNFVITRTPTQVASHAQKYFIRQLSGGKDKRRASIHDITTVNLNENTRTPSPESNLSTPSPDQFQQHQNQHQHQHQHQPQMSSFQWNQPNDNNNESIMAFNSTNGNMFMPSSPYGNDSFGLKMQGHHNNNLHRGAAVHDSSSYLGNPHSMVFQMQSAQHYTH